MIFIFQTLKELHLGWNSIDNEGLDYLSNLLQKNHVRLKFNSF